MKRYIGIARELGEFGKWYSINILLFNKMLKITLWTPVTKRPTFYFYNKAAFDYSINEQEIIQFSWFIGLIFN